MNGPSPEVRNRVYAQLSQLPTTRDGVRAVSVEVERALEHTLEDIDALLREDIEASSELQSSDLTEEQGEDLLAAAESWASLASYAVSWVYAPMSPPPIDLAGWTKEIPKQLRRIARSIHWILERVAKALSVDSISVGVSFPWGVSVSVSWNS